MNSELKTIGRLSASLGLLWAFTGCNEMAAEDEFSEVSEAEGAATTGDNGLTSVNGLSSQNGLTSVNGLSSQNGLTSINGLSSQNGLMTFAEGRVNVKYLVRCALPAGRFITKQDQYGVTHTFSGLMGMGPGWETGACDTACQQGISACMMAHVNTAGVHIPLWMVSPNTNVGWGTSGSYPNREGTYFGNIFQSPPKAHYCNGPSFANSTVPGRLGAYQSNKPYTNPFGTDAVCGSGCVAGGPASEGYNSCNGFANPVTVWRQPAPAFDSTRDYKICSKHSGKCLDADLNQNWDGGRVIQWAFGGGNNQKWKITKLEDSYFKICNKGTGRCLDLYLGDPKDGGRICTWGYYANQYQRWAITPVGGGNHSIVAKLGAKSLQVKDASTANGGLIHQWSYQGTPSQIWTITAL